MANPALWSHETFAGFMRTSPRRAFEFRLETLGDPIPEEYLTDSEKAGNETEIVTPTTGVVQDGSEGTDIGTESNEKAPDEVPIVETPDEVVEVEITRDELKAKLDEAGVKYFKGADSQKLADLCVANNLL